MIRSLVFLLALAACGTIADAGPSGVFAVSVPEPWPGAEVRVTSADFRHTDGPAVLKADTFTVNLTRVNDTVMSGKLPERAIGELAVTLDVDGYHFLLPTISIAGGYVESVELNNPDAAFQSQTYWIPSADGAVLIGENARRMPAVLNLDTRTVQSVGMVNNVAPSEPGPTYQPGVYLLKPVGSRVESWGLVPTISRLEVHADLPGVDLDQWRIHRTRLGPNAWVFADDNSLWTVRRASANSPYNMGGVEYGLIYAMRFSPRGDRAFFTGVRRTESPVYAIPEGTVAYNIPIAETRTAAFFPEGGTLALTVAPFGPEGLKTTRMVLLDATTGAIQKDTVVTGFIFEMLADPDRPVLYAGLFDSTKGPSVLVFQRAPLRLIARLDPPADAPVAGRYFFGSLAISPRKGLYVYSNSRYWRFTLPPVH